MTLKETALSYAELNFAVFPLVPADKIPAVKNWGKLATTDKEIIIKWWDENPRYNIGIATGVPSGGLVVLDVDVDVQKGINGVECLKKWQNEHGLQIPSFTAVAKTGRGGLHIFFRDTEAMYHNAVDILKNGSGIDVRGNGGYVVAPGSIHPNGTLYEWVRHPSIFGVAKIDTAVKALLSAKNNPSKVSITSGSSIGEGERNAKMFQLASSLQAKGLSREAITAAVTTENSVKCNPPLDLNEIERIVSSAQKYPNGTSPYTGKAGNISTDILTLSTVEEKEPEWLIEGYIPRREISILAGDGGTGKTFAWCAIAAAVSSGYRCFMRNNMFATTPERAPEKVLFFSSEDSFEYVLRRRLRKNGADLDNIKTLDCADERFQELSLNSDFLERLISAHRPALCIFDPLQSFVRGANMISRSEMRGCMKKLHTYGEKYGTTFLIIMHTNKMQSVWGRSRLSDSSDIWDIARSVMIVGKADELGNRYISHEKSNYGPQEKTVLYSIVDEIVRYQSYTDKRDRDFVLAAAKKTKEKPSEEEAENFILSFLEDHGGSVEVGAIDTFAETGGISKYAIRSAKDKLKKSGKITVERVGNGRGKGFHWVVSSIPAF